MLTPCYLLCVSAVCVLAACTGFVSAAGEFCHGWMDRRSVRREGFYCPERGDKRNAIICCGMCDYRYCCSDSTARLDQGTCVDRDSKTANRDAAQADNNEYPVYVPFLIVGSAFLALLIFGGSAYLLYNRQSAHSEPEEAVSTATAAMTTIRAPCGSASSLAALGDQPRRNHGNQPPANQDAAAVALRGPLANENAALTMRRALVPPPTHPCAHCISLANQHAGPPVNQIGSQSHGIHRYPVASQPPPPPLYMPIVLPPLPLPLPHHDRDHPPPRHFHTHPQITHPPSRALPPPQYATMPASQGHHERPPPPLSPRPKLPSSPFDPSAAAPQLPSPPFMHGYILQHHTHGPLTTHTHTPYANLRIPSPPPRFTHTHHAVL